MLEKLKEKLGFKKKEPKVDEPTRYVLAPQRTIIAEEALMLAILFIHQPNTNKKYKNLKDLNIQACEDFVESLDPAIRELFQKVEDDDKDNND